MSVKGFINAQGEVEKYDFNSLANVPDISGSSVVGRGEGNNSVISINEAAANFAAGESATAIGKNNTASGNRSTAIGANNASSATGSTTLGLNNIASAQNAIAIGCKMSSQPENQATQPGAIAIGVSNQSGGMYSVAIGTKNVTSSPYTVTLGSENEASQVGAVAIGLDTKASGYASTSVGYYTEATGAASFVAGVYNEPDSNPIDSSITAGTGSAIGARKYLLIVGNGADSENKSNAATIDWNGNAEFAGKVTVGVAPVADMDAATKKYVDDHSGGGGSMPEVTISTTGSVTQALDAGKIYHFTGALTALTITLNAPASGALAEYHFDFLSGSTAPTLTMPNTVTMPDSFTVEANKRYEVDVLNNYGVVASWANS